MELGELCLPSYTIQDVVVHGKQRCWLRVLQLHKHRPYCQSMVIHKLPMNQERFLIHVPKVEKDVVVTERKKRELYTTRRLMQESSRCSSLPMAKEHRAHRSAMPRSITDGGAHSVNLVTRSSYCDTCLPLRHCQHSSIDIGRMTSMCICMSSATERLLTTHVGISMKGLMLQ